MKKFSGSCHCGSITFAVECDLEKAYMCDCSICSRRGAKMAYADASNFNVLSDNGYLSKYQFGEMKAEHYFCSNCGIYTHHKPKTLKDKMGFNIACIDSLESESIEIVKVKGSAR
jgi:hypothetical protein